MTTDHRIERAEQLYLRATFGGETGALDVADRELDGVEADLALARGRLIHARWPCRSSSGRWTSRRGPATG